MNKLIKLKFEVLKEFQEKHPTAHVGGSIGLFLRGVYLFRDLSISDLDITIDEFELEPDILKNYEQRSDANDFDYAIKKSISSGLYVKIDIRVCPEPSFDVIEFEGVNYNVSKYKDIIYWKTKYANKGVAKHISDLEVIKTGIRPLEPISPTFVDNDDDLPY